MLTKLTAGLLLIGIILCIIITLFLKKGRIPMKYALVWYVPSLSIIILALFPEVFEYIAYLFGFQTISNLIVGYLFVVLFLIIIALTVIIAGQTTKINLLIQEVSILKEKVK